MTLLSHLIWIIIFVIVCIIQTIQKKTDKNSCKNSKSDFCGSHQDIVRRYFAKRKGWKTPNLGSILFKNVPYEKFSYSSVKNKTYVVLIWSHFKWLKRRHIDGFSKKSYRADPLKHCSVKNCLFTGNDDQIHNSDAVVVHIQKGKLPQVTNRTKKQIYIILNDESPMNMFSLTHGKHPTFKDLANVMFNWTMTYKVESDISVPYGRTVPLKKPLIKQFNTAPLSKIVPHWTSKNKDVLVYVLMSNCVPYRMGFLRNVQKHMKVDIFGGCATNKTHKKFCRRDYSSESCNYFNKYLFYFVIENSRCHQYISEKIFAHAYTKGAIPVILGPPLKDCEKLLPPKSFVHVNSFKNVEELVMYMKNISGNEEVLRGYHRWRNHFKVVNEHGYFGSKSYHYCRVCEALNYNNRKVKIYGEEDLKRVFDKQYNCISSKEKVFQGYKMNKNITFL